MNLGFLGTSKAYRGKFAAVMLLNIGTLSWFFILIQNMENIFINLNMNSHEWASFVGNSLIYGFAIFWIVAISFMGTRINRRKLLLTSIALGIFSTVLLAFARGPFFTSIVSSLMGTSLGLVLPSSMALIADNTIVENRGRASGIIIMGTFIIAFASLAIYRMTNLDLPYLVLTMVAVRSISLFAFVKGEVGKPLTRVEKKIRLPATAYREFLFYLCPWVLFTIASTLVRTSIFEAGFESELTLGEYLRYPFMAVFGLAAGFIADRFGRKQPIILGIATFGIGSLLFGFNMSGTSAIVYYALSGITWGLFFVVFLAVPGDLSTPILREKFYALGYILPVTALFALATIPFDLGDLLPLNLIFQILGVCIFLSMVPVFRAKETLPESKKREMRMKEYLERLGKTIQEVEENE